MCIPSTTIAGAGHIQSIFASESLFISFTPESTVTLTDKCTRLHDAPRTHDVGLPTQFRFNLGPASQPIAGSMAANTWHSMMFQCSPTVFDAISTLKQY